MRRFLLVLGLTATMLATALPSQAATFSWKDPADDAVVAVEPSEPTLDLLASAISSDGTKIEWTATLKEAAEAEPPASFGYFFVFEFVYNELGYDLRVREDASASTITLRPAETGAQDLPCKDCTYKLDRKAKQVSIKVPIASLAASIKQADPEAAPFAKGSAIEALLVNSYRSYIGISLRADDAPAPDGTTFRL